MVCRRLLGPLDRAAIMAGLEAGLSQVFTPRQISAPPVRGGVRLTALPWTLLPTLPARSVTR